MKRLIFFAALLIAITISMGSCNQAADGDYQYALTIDTLDSVSAHDSTKFTVRRFAFTDSLVDEQTRQISSYNVTIDLPQGPKPLVRGISHWLNEVLEVETESNTFDSSSEAMKRQAKAFYANANEDGARHTFRAAITKVYEDSAFVSYEYNGEVYSGGENSMPYFYGMTFDKATGKAIGYDIFAKTDSLKTLVYEQILAYFNDTTAEHTETSIYETALADFPLPKHPAWIVDSGFVFSY